MRRQILVGAGEFEHSRVRFSKELGLSQLAPQREFEHSCVGKSTSTF